VIQVKDLSFRFHQKTDRVLFQNLNFHISQGERVSIIGPSGSGKSTLIKLLGKLLIPTEVTHLEVAQPVGWVFQEPRLVPWLTIQENLSLALVKPSDPTLLKELLQLVQLSEELLNHYPHQLSGGQKMRVALARALLKQPKVLLLDEPLNALDEDLRVELQDELLNLQKKFHFTLLMVTHSLAEALKIGEKIFLVSSFGQISEVNPHREADPLLFLQSQFKKLRSKEINIV